LLEASRVTGTPSGVFKGSRERRGVRVGEVYAYVTPAFDVRA
jgi:hypothetical protein